MTARIQAHNQGILDIDGPPKKTYDVSIFDKTVFTTVTAYPEGVNEWIGSVKSRHSNSTERLVIALDFEQGPSEDRFGTLQLCVFRDCLVFQIVHGPSVPQLLVQFLSDRNNTFVGFRINAKLQRLRRVCHFERNARYSDLGNHVAHRYGRQDVRNWSLSEFSTLVLGKHLDMPELATNWDPLELSEVQVMYAAVRAFVAYEISARLPASFI